MTIKIRQNDSYLVFERVILIASWTNSCNFCGNKVRFPNTFTRTPFSASLSFSSIRRWNFSVAKLSKASTSACGLLKFSILKFKKERFYGFV